MCRASALPACSCPGILPFVTTCHAKWSNQKKHTYSDNLILILSKKKQSKRTDNVQWKQRLGPQNPNDQRALGK